MLELILYAASVILHAASVTMKLLAVALLLCVAVAWAATCNGPDMFGHACVDLGESCMVGDFGGRTIIDPPDGGCVDVSFASGATLYGTTSTSFGVFQDGIVVYDMCFASIDPHIAALSARHTFSELRDDGEVTHEEHNGNFIITYDSVSLYYFKRDTDPISSQVIITPIAEMVVVHHFESDPETSQSGAVDIGIADQSDSLLDLVDAGEQCKGTASVHQLY